MFDISAVNLSRALRWHPQGLQSWSMSDWAVAFAGEVGEVCEAAAAIAEWINLPMRQLAPGHVTNSGPWQSLRNELGDVYAYLDLFAQSVGLSVTACVDTHSGGIAFRRTESILANAVLLSRAAGKLCDVVKKLNRVRDGLSGNTLSPDELRLLLGRYIAMTAMVLEQFGTATGKSLSVCVVDKFNAVSERMGFPERL